MKLIVGLGNPGSTYAHTRHNVGFMVLDRLASELSGGAEKKQGQSLVTQASYKGERVILVKPQTYMNLSGNAVWEMINFYKDGVDEMIVVHDDLDMPLGRLRFKNGGGAGGHNGLITQRLGSDQYERLKIGIGRPPEFMKTEVYVLRGFSLEERQVLDKMLDLACQGLLYWLEEGCVPSMNKFNSCNLAPKPEKEDGETPEDGQERRVLERRPEEK